MNGTADRWPELPWREWEATLSTVHMWTQIVGKVRMASAPPLNHWWHVPLYVSSRGLTTSAVPYGQESFQIDFDFIDHQLRLSESRGGSRVIELAPRSVKQFYREVMQALHELRIDVRIWTTPVEVPEAIPFEVDEQHASYDPAQANLLWRSLLDADRVLGEFRVRFLGKASPVHLFWGSFDLAASRFSGRRAPRHPGGAPNCADWVMEEAYSHEVSSAGWWPAGNEHGPAFYAYLYPEPEGFAQALVRPEAASYDHGLRDFLLPYDAVRSADDPDGAVLDFFQSTYEAGANLARWDRPGLEPAFLPDRPPRRAWTLSPAEGRSDRRWPLGSHAQPAVNHSSR